MTLRQLLQRYWSALLPLTVVAYLAYWYLVDPVPSGVYPARLAGQFVVDTAEPKAELPVIWVRPHPFAKVPPILRNVGFVGASDEQKTVIGSSTVHTPFGHPQPIWLQPRRIEAYVTVPFPEGGLQAAGVTWRIDAGTERVYRFGPLDVIHAPRPLDPASLAIIGWGPVLDFSQGDSHTVAVARSPASREGTGYHR